MVVQDGTHGVGRRADGQDTVFYQANLETGRYHMARELPAMRMLRARFETGTRPVLSLAPEAFRCPNVSASPAASRSA